ncbi:hypothetical protein WJX72_011741 [[Myrmecia] bisecta]|uniref:Uncharacterized protein n=1 Tax=[Myrmecia] bisecta TaxID=41462 RepID=A0AAW1RB33_9CHLO
MTERHTKRQKISSQVDPAKVGELEAFLFGAQPAELAQPFADVVHQDGVEGAVWEDRQGSSGTAAVAGQAEKQPAWEDADDATVEVNVASRNRLRKLRQSEEEVALAGVEYEQRLRCQHVKMHPRTSWASRDADQQPATLLTGTAPLLGRSTVLAPGLLETTRVKDANQHEPSKSVVRSVEFHSAGQLLLTAGLDKQLRIFQVDGVHNTKVQTVAFEDMPIAKAAFANGGSQVVAAGRRKYVYLVDLESSRVERVADEWHSEVSSLFSRRVRAIDIRW